MNSDDLEPVRALLDRLYRGYQRSALHRGSFELSIPLARAVLRRLSADEDGGSVRHVVVLGPTQAGKSTVVNLLLRGEHALVSPLAGFTRALAGFAGDLSAAQLESVRRYLAATTRAAAHTLTEVDSAALGAGVVVWDTPDFDSVSSLEYRVDIADAAALADLIVVVVSREKYADLSVWRTLDLLQPLPPPLLLCLNKSGTDATSLVDSLRQRLAESRFEAAQVSLCTLPYARNADGALAAAGEALRRAVGEHLVGLTPAQHRAGLQRLLAEHWQQWLAPVHEEIAQAQAWNEAVAGAIDAMSAAHRKRYLDDARYYTSFNQAVARLLELLEIPGLAGPLAKTRQVLTWPLRKLFGVAEPPADGAPRQDMEAAVLSEALDHGLLSLRQHLNERALDGDQGAIWAAALNRTLTDQETSLRATFATALQRYQQDFEDQIAAAAKSLYAELERRPAVLNGLRAARVSADAAGVLLAVKTGAVGVNEALLTPAMLSLTSLLTESAVGKYVDTVREELKQRQQEHVSEWLGGFGATLRRLPSQLDDDRLFAIDAADIDRAQRAVRVSPS